MLFNLLIFITLLISAICYIKIAKAKNINDTPNERSSHTEVTLRGGGIVYIISILLFYCFYPVTVELQFFIIAIVLVALISFLDDLMTLTSKIRIVVHFVAFGLMFYGLDLLGYNGFMSTIFTGLLFVLSLGFLNIYNFMDGINGITVLNALAVYGSLLFVNLYIVSFVQKDLLIVLILASFVFGFFNFRKKAICFAGDIGSITIGFSIVYFILKLYLKTNSLFVFLFIAIYLIDGGWTIIDRLLKKQNIFKPHKLHLYQILVNEFKLPHLIVASIYFIVQLLISSIAVFFLYNSESNYFFAIIIFGVFSLVYLLIKKNLQAKLNSRY